MNMSKAIYQTGDSRRAMVATQEEFMDEPIGVLQDVVSIK